MTIRTMAGEDIDPYEFDHGGRLATPAMRAARQYLESGKWVVGAALLKHMSQAIEPGAAYRWVQEHLDPASTADMSKEAQIEKGKHRLAVIALRPQLDRGNFVTDPERVGKEHLAGRLPWRVRDLYPGAVGTKVAARVINISDARLTYWIRDGDVPTPPRHEGKGPYLITPDILAVLRRIRPYWQGTHWGPPRGLWEDHAATACPHCGGPLVIETIVGVPRTAPVPAGPTEEVASEGREEV